MKEIRTEKARYIVETEDGHRTSGVLNFYKELGESVIPLQKGLPPYMPVENGYFGYYGVTLLDKTLDRIQCHVCGRWFKSLNAHLKIHDIDHIVYKDRFQLYRKESLMCLKTKYKFHQQKDRSGNRNLVPIKIAKNQEGWEEKRKEMSEDARQKVQWQNKYGTCEAQIKFRIKQFPTLEEASKDKTMRRLIERRFGSWENGLRHYKLVPFTNLIKN